MTRADLFKTVLTGILFAASCVLLIATYGASSNVIAAYGGQFPMSFGEHVPAFSRITVSLMQNSVAICFGSLAVTLALGGLTLMRAKAGEAKRYWLTVLAAINFNVSAWLLSVILVGYFLLPKVANGG